jgi:hypothetical protein
MMVWEMRNRTCRKTFITHMYFKSLMYLECRSVTLTMVRDNLWLKSCISVVLGGKIFNSVLKIIKTSAFSFFYIIMQNVSPKAIDICILCYIIKWQICVCHLQ